MVDHRGIPLVVAIDDTDMPDTRGTGRLARWLDSELSASGAGISLGVTRHQLFEGPGVAKTANNSAAAIGLLSTAPLHRVFEIAAACLRREFIPGSDPGVAVLTGSPAPGLLAFARGARSGLVEREEAEAQAASAGVAFAPIGGDGSGVIGAVAAAALRADGNDGRFIGLPGIRQRERIVAVGTLRGLVPGLSIVEAGSGTALPSDDMLDTGGWVRPRLSGGIPVLLAERTEREGFWRNADERPVRR